MVSSTLRERTVEERKDLRGDDRGVVGEENALREVYLQLLFPLLLVMRCQVIPLEQPPSPPSLVTVVSCLLAGRGSEIAFEDQDIVQEDLSQHTE
jgi:hypothetical protein